VDLPTLPTFMFEANLRGLLSFVVAFLLPLVAALLTRASTPGWVKGVTLLFLAGTKSVIEAFIAGGADFNLSTTVYTVALNFGVAVIAYFGLLRGSPPQIHAQNSLVK
jgi:hypothetical protein